MLVSHNLTPLTCPCAAENVVVRANPNVFRTEAHYGTNGLSGVLQWVQGHPWNFHAREAIAAEASVNMVVSGIVGVSGNQTTLSIQLVQVPDGAIVSAATHECGSRDLFALQNVAVRHIFDTLH